MAWRRKQRFRQQLLPFGECNERRERWFKRGIIAATMVLLMGVVAGVPGGRDVVIRLSKQAKWMAQRTIGIEPQRMEIEAERLRQRHKDIEQTRLRLKNAVRHSPQAVARFLRLARMDAETAMIRWGNYEHSVVFSSAVFEPHEQGRSYTLRPETKAIWVVGISLGKVPASFLVPNTPEVLAAARSAGARVLDFSAQKTNSWGFRGPEADQNAPVRGVVLGDSMMQGVFVLDDQTPPAQLEQRLSEMLEVQVSILNTGILAYSPEQYYYTLQDVVDRFRPQFVVVSVCANDFGDMEVKANWNEAEYWFDRIRIECDRRGMLLLLVPAPLESALHDRSTQAVYPGRVAEAFKAGGRSYLDLIEAFTEEHLHWELAALGRGVRLPASPLFNGHLGDYHFSAQGGQVWAANVARRLLLVWEESALRGLRVPEAIRLRTKGPQ